MLQINVTDLQQWVRERKRERERERERESDFYVNCKTCLPFLGHKTAIRSYYQWCMSYWCAFVLETKCVLFFPTCWISTGGQRTITKLQGKSITNYFRRVVPRQDSWYKNRPKLGWLMKKYSKPRIIDEKVAANFTCWSWKLCVFKNVFDNLQSLQTYNLQATTCNLQPRIDESTQYYWFL